MTSFTSSKLTERDALIVLNAINGFGIKRIRQLIERFGSAADALRAPLREFLEFPGLPQATRVNLRSFSVEVFMERDGAGAIRAGARVVTFLDKDYPQSLLTIESYPPVLYVVGQFPELLDCSVAMVGSRRPSLYGLQTARRFAAELAEYNVPVISGMARGVDAAAHKGAIMAGGKTVAVLGCGLDIMYPPENHGLYQEIKEHGCVISEFPFGAKPLPDHFPRRNRIVSGLSLGVVVIEANIKSGALVTAGFALEQGREVFAVPGRIDSALSDGPHALIRQGAKPVLSVKDILDDLPLTLTAPVGKEADPAEQCLTGRFSAEERSVFSLIVNGCDTYEGLEAKTGFGPVTLMPILLGLELRGKVVQKPGRVYEVK